MKKLDNKGMTTVEILITFVIVAGIVVAMYSSIMSLKNKQTIESYKENLTTYKNLLTKDIQDDLIKVGLAGVNKNVSGGVTTITLTLKDGSKRILEVTNSPGCTAINEDEVSSLCTSKGIDKNKSDNFSIKYGPVGNAIEYKLPNLGKAEIKKFTGTGNRTIYDLRIGKVDVSTDNNIFSLYVQLIHPDLGSKYSINIISPINY